MNRHQRIHTRWLKHHPPLTEERKERLWNEAVELERKIEEGTDRDWLIYELYNETAFDDHPKNRVQHSDYITAAGYQLFHSELEPFSDEEIADEADRQEKEYGDRLRWEELTKSLHTNTTKNK